MRRLDRDAALLLASAFVRAVTVGLTGVTLAIYLHQVGLSATGIGAVIGVGIAGGMAATLIAGFQGDRFGRRKTLVALALVGAAGYLGLAVADRLASLVPLAFAGMLNGMGRDRGAAVAVEQALLPATTDDRGRTWLLAWYNVAMDTGHALGALAGVVPTVIASTLHMDPIAAHRGTYVICAVAMAATAVPYSLLSSRIEAARRGLDARHTRVSAPSRRAIGRLAALFGIDSLGGGFLSSALIAYWFFQRFGISEAGLAGVFFTARALNTVGHMGAAWMAGRIGLVNTMVLTHLPSSLFIMAAPAAPTATLAILLFLCREALVEMDVPTRQSYVMAIVAPHERTVASSVTNLTRNVGWAVGPSIAGVVMQGALAAPIFIGGTLKIAYDVMLYRSFRHLRPPEERG